MESLNAKRGADIPVRQQAKEDLSHRVHRVPGQEWPDSWKAP